MITGNKEKWHKNTSMWSKTPDSVGLILEEKIKMNNKSLCVSRRTPCRSAYSLFPSALDEVALAFLTQLVCDYVNLKVFLWVEHFTSVHWQLRAVLSPHGNKTFINIWPKSEAVSDGPHGGTLQCRRRWIISDWTAMFLDRRPFFSNCNQYLL